MNEDEVKFEYFKSACEEVFTKLNVDCWITDAGSMIIITRKTNGLLLSSILVFKPGVKVNEWYFCTVGAKIDGQTKFRGVGKVRWDDHDNLINKIEVTVSRLIESEVI